jgi:hypothetical protein
VLIQGDLAGVASGSGSGSARKVNGSSTNGDNGDGEDSTLVGHGNGDDDAASTRGMVSPSDRGRSSRRHERSESGSTLDSISSAGEGEDGVEVGPDGAKKRIPKIKISSSSETDLADGLDSSITAKGKGKGKENGFGDDAVKGLEKPGPTAAGEDGEGEEPLTPVGPSQEVYSFSNKRLCERWLDNLFMVLYEVCLSLTRFRAYLTKLTYSPFFLFRTCASGRSSELKWHTSKLSM